MRQLHFVGDGGVVKFLGSKYTDCHCLQPEVSSDKHVFMWVSLGEVN